MEYTAARLWYRIVSAEQEGLWNYRQKVYQIRGIVAGAKEFLQGNSAGESLDPGQRMQRLDTSTRPDIMVQKVLEGKSNDLLNLIWQLAQKTALKFPDVFFEHVEAVEQQINAAYLKDRLGPTIFDGCESMVETAIANLDYLMGGLGCLYLPVEDGGRPGWRWADTLDLIWDQTSRTPNKSTWMALSVSEPLWKWLEMFPDNAVLRTYAGRANKLSDLDWHEDDMPTTLTFYYDVEGEGHQAVFLKTADNVYEKEPVLMGDNPHMRKMAGGKSVPFLPFTVTFFIALPSVRLPIGVAEKMLPSQTAIWRAIQLIQDIIDRGSPFYAANEDGFADEKARERFKKAGNPGAIVMTKGAPETVITRIAALDIPAAMEEELARNKREVFEQVGSNNAAGGQGTPGFGGKKMTATEFEGIMGQSQLTPGAVQTDMVRMYEDAIPRFLWNGKLFDKAPFMCTIGKVDYVFSAGKPDAAKKTLGPIGPYLRPDKRVTVGDDSLGHIPKAQKIKDAEQDVEIGLKVAQVFPNALRLSLREYYELRGKANPDEYLEQPQPPPGAAPAGGMPPAGATVGQV